MKYDLTANGVNLLLLSRINVMKLADNDQLSELLHELALDFKSSQVDFTYKEIEHRVYVFSLSYTRTYDEELKFKTITSTKVKL